MSNNSEEKAELTLGSCHTKLVEWLKCRPLVVLASIVITAALVLAVLVSVFLWSYLVRDPVQKVPDKFNEVKLYTDEENDLDGAKVDFDDESFSTEFDPDKPVFLKSKMDTVKLDQTEPSHGVVSHDALLRDEFDGGKKVKNSEIYAQPYLPLGYREEGARKKSDHTGEDDLRELSELKSLGERHATAKSDKPTESHAVVDLVKAIDEKMSKSIDETGEQRHSIDSSETPPMTLYRVTNAVKAGAVCLDGSPPAYYHRPGTGSSEKLWIIHFNGGAWCFDAKACFERSHSSLGSTKKLPPAPPIIQGINSPDPAVNPDFYDWNLVWVVYCDGASFTGNRERPLISDSGETIYMRGKRVLNAIINDLLFNRDFKFAEAIILTGSSAGSMTAIFQADYVASKFPKTIPVRVLSDAGFFIDTAPLGGKNLGAMFKRIYEMQNSSAGLDQDCVQDLGEEDAWQCFLPSKIVKYVKTPMFVLNSAYDIWAMIYFLDIDCKFPITEQQSRKKRSTGRNLVLHSDSELAMTFQPTEFENFMMKRSVQRRKRDMSGFELMPFFRQVKSTRRVLTNITYNNNTVVRNSTSLENERLLKDYKNVTKILDKDSHLYPSNVSNSSRSETATRPKQLEVLKMSFKGNNLKRKEVLANDKDEKLLTSVLEELGDVEKPESLETVNELSHKMSVSITKDSAKKSKLTNRIKPLSKPTNETHLISIKSTIPKTNYDNIGTLRNRTQDSLDKFDLTQEQLALIGLKRHKVSDSKKPSRLKSRRSTSIAKEYINILRSDPPECTERQLLDAMKYRGAMLGSTEYFMHFPKSGRFLVSCIDHSLSLFDETWTGVTVNGKTIQQAFGDWFYERGNRNKHNFVDCPYPCNPTCP